MIRNINTYALIGILLVAVAMIVAIIGVILLSKYKNSKKDTLARTKRIMILAGILFDIVFGITNIGLVFVLLS